MKGLITECVITAITTLKWIKVSLGAIYFRLTAFIPRRLPETEAEFESLRYVLSTYLGLKDEPEVWTTVFGEIASTKREKVRKSYGIYVNVARRLEVNKVAQALKMVEIGKLQVKLERKLKELEGDGAEVPKGPSDIQGTVSILPGPEEGMGSVS